MERRVPFHWVRMGVNERSAVDEAIRTNWLSPRGPKLKELGDLWAQTIGVKYAWPVSSGTGAIHIALMALGVGPGSKVAVPSYTCSPGVYPVSYVGAEPVFIDCEYETMGMCPSSLARAIEDHDIDAAIPVHLYGSSCNPEVISLLKYNEGGIRIVEDACESDGARYLGPHRTWEMDYVGTRGDIGTFSLRGDKVLTALGTGGLFTTNNEELFRKMKLMSDLSLRNDATMERYRDLEFIGMNYEMNNPSAAFAIEQIKGMNEIIEDRRSRAKAWYAALSGAKDVEIMADYDHHVWYQFPIRFTKFQNVLDFDVFGQALLDRGVAFIPPFWPMHLQPAYVEKHGDSHCPRAVELAHQVFLFPCYPDLTDPDIKYLVDIIMEEYGRS